VVDSDLVFVFVEVDFVALWALDLVILEVKTKAFGEMLCPHDST